jgi:hypothetical protein
LPAVTASTKTGVGNTSRRCPPFPNAVTHEARR